MPKDKRKVRIAAVGDIHCNRSSQGAFQPLFSEINEKADVLVLCGDLTDYGLPEEAHVLVRELAVLRVPVLAVLGNHDFESGKQDEVTGILGDAGVLMLDGDAQEVAGVGFAGAKGFAGGFGTGTLAPWGEAAVKAFVQEAVNEAMKLEKAVARLRTPHKIVVLHYAPIQTTVEGEPEAIFPFLGSSRLEEPLARYPVSAVFHGHAHRGTLEGRTMSGSPVYNVAMPLLKRDFPNKPPFYLFEVGDEGTSDMPVDGRVRAEV
ncbi:MAG TPA: metallophosphoesterase [Chloroflexia bacterium]|nr:metallophosphoesterase [Chloroflexia bacterium]